MLEAENSQDVIMGQLKLPTQGATGGILIGRDVRIYRGAAHTLFLEAGDFIQFQGTAGIIFRDSDIRIRSLSDGWLDLFADIGVDLNAPVLTLGTTRKIQFRDTTTYVSSKDDGHLDLDAEISVDINSPGISIESYIEHSGDIDTYIEFQTNQITLRAGNVAMIDFNATTLAFFGATKTTQAAHLADPTDLATCITAITTLIDELKAYGLIAADP